VWQRLLSVHARTLKLIGSTSVYTVLVYQRDEGTKRVDDYEEWNRIAPLAETNYLADARLDTWVCKSACSSLTARAEKTSHFYDTLAAVACDLTSLG